MSARNTLEPGLVPTEVVASMSGLDFLTAMVEGRLPPPPFAALFDVRLAEVSHGRAVFRATTSDHMYNPLGSVHGGIAMAMLDSCMGCAVHSTLVPGVGYTTLEVKTNFVRALRGDTGVIEAIGTIVHAGSRIATAESRLVDASGRLYAHATTTCLLFPLVGPDR